MQRIWSLVSRVPKDRVCPGLSARVVQSRDLFTAARPSLVLPVYGREIVRPLDLGHGRRFTSENLCGDDDRAKLPTGTLMSFGAPYKYKAGDWADVDPFLGQNPVITKALPGRLIVPTVDKSYVCDEGGRSFMSNALLLPHACNMRRILTEGLFTDDNLGVLTKIASLAFKEIPPCQNEDIPEDIRRKCLKEAIDYLKRKVMETSGLEEADLPTDIILLFDMAQDPCFDIEEMLTNAALLSREGRGLLVNRIYKAMRELLIMDVMNSSTNFGKKTNLYSKVEQLSPNWLSGKTHTSTPPGMLKVCRILDGLPYTTRSVLGLTEWNITAGDRKNFFYPWTNQYLRGNSSGLGLLDLHRHGGAHSMEEAVLKHIAWVASQLKITVADPTYYDVIDLFHYEWRAFLPLLVRNCRKEGLDLDLWTLFNLPITMT